MDFGNYNISAIKNSGTQFRNNWIWKENRNQLLKQIRLSSYYNPITIIYPEEYTESVFDDPRGKSKSNKRKTISKENEKVLTFKCDFCTFCDECSTKVYDHCQKTQHTSFSQYEVDSMGVHLLKPFYFIDFQQMYPSTLLFICPFCNIVFPDKFLCGFHVRISHHTPGSFYSTCSVISKYSTEVRRLRCCQKKFKSSFDLLEHWSGKKFRCCGIFTQHKMACLEGLFMVICKSCLTSSLDRYSNPDMVNICDFLMSHQCFRRPNGDLNYDVECLEVEVSDWDALKVYKIHDFKDQNIREALLFYQNICEGLVQHIQRNHNHDNAFIVDALQKYNDLELLMKVTLG